MILIKKQLTRVLVGVALLGAAAQARGDTIALGVLSLDTLIPGNPGAPGVNAFNVSNFGGSNSLAPDFPVVGNISFLASSLTLVGDFMGTIDLGTVLPGSTSLPSLEFVDTALFSSATFTGTLSQLTLNLFDGRVLTASQSTVTAKLLPSSGTALVPGADLVVLTVDASDVPEPDYRGALGIVLTALFVVVRRRTRPC